MIDYKELRIMGYMKKDIRKIYIKYKNIEEVIEFEKYQSKGVLNQIDSLLKEFYKTGNKKILEAISRCVNVTINTFYRKSLPSGFGISYSYFR